MFLALSLRRGQRRFHPYQAPASTAHGQCRPVGLCALGADVLGHLLSFLVYRTPPARPEQRLANRRALGELALVNQSWRRALLSLGDCYQDASLYSFVLLKRVFAHLDEPVWWKPARVSGVFATMRVLPGDRLFRGSAEDLASLFAPAHVARVPAGLVGWHLPDGRRLRQDAGEWYVEEKEAAEEEEEDEGLTTVYVHSEAVAWYVAKHCDAAELASLTHQLLDPEPPSFRSDDHQWQSLCVRLPCGTLGSVRAVRVRQPGLEQVPRPPPPAGGGSFRAPAQWWSPQQLVCLGNGVVSAVPSLRSEVCVCAAVSHAFGDASVLRAVRGLQYSRQGTELIKQEDGSYLEGAPLARPRTEQVSFVWAPALVQYLQWNARPFHQQLIWQVLECESSRLVPLAFSFSQELVVRRWGGKFRAWVATARNPFEGSHVIVL